MQTSSVRIRGSDLSWFSDVPFAWGAGADSHVVCRQMLVWSLLTSHFFNYAHKTWEFFWGVWWCRGLRASCIFMVVRLISSVIPRPSSRNWTVFTKCPKGKFFMQFIQICSLDVPALRKYVYVLPMCQGKQLNQCLFVSMSWTAVRDAPVCCLSC